ncbi:MAG: FAD-dependent oxidoreductase [Xenococcaceae cyanobacterium MO_188.B32]|nr:FAD-dependent oxidoreductase [Xenococcaceae cyanobacterium MO_188.B32]
MLSNQVYDVLIVGAGPVGLATAIALRQRGINNILVIDRARSFRQVGQGIDILPNGLKALKYIDIQAMDI